MTSCGPVSALLLLCLISLEPCLATASPFYSQQHLSPRAALGAIPVAWLLPVLISFIPVLLLWHQARGTGGTGGRWHRADRKSVV